MDLDVVNSLMASDIQSAIPADSSGKLSSRHITPYRERLHTGYVHDVRMMGHAPLSEHPEMPQRISEIVAVLSENNVIQQMIKLPVRAVQRQEALMVHSEEHWDKVMAIQYMDERAIVDSESYYERISLYVHPLTTLAAKLSCGGVIESCLAVARARVQNAFAIVRPPGHHAEPDEHMGFCFFNNVAIAARVIQQETPLQRILILDWDVHHGNGVQRAFYDDPSVLYISLHRFDGGEFYPCGPFGGMTMCGFGPGLGTSVNIPWPDKGMGDADYLYAFQKLVMPIAYEFAPEFVIISAGFDAAEGDELGECNVTPAGYAHMTHMLMSLAGGKVVVALEGGYNLDSLSVSALAVAKILLGSPPPELPPLMASDIATETVFQCAYVQSRYWKSIDPKSLEPSEELTPAQVTIPDIIKGYRAHYLAKQYGMLDIPFVDDALRECFMSQTFTSDDIFSADTIVLFAHDFGDLRSELHGRLDCSVRLENSYLVDASRNLIDWCRRQGMAIIDINLFHQPPSGPVTDTELTKKALQYIWDNYIEISQHAQRAVLIAYGSACEPMLSFMSSRSIQRLVRAVVQVLGHQPVPRLHGEKMLQWYPGVSYVVVPQNYPSLQKIHDSSRFRNIHVSPETSPIHTLIESLTSIQQFVQNKVGVTEPPQHQPRSQASETFLT